MLLIVTFSGPLKLTCYFAAFQKSWSRSSSWKCFGHSDSQQHNESLRATPEPQGRGPLSSSALTQCPPPAPGQAGANTCPVWPTTEHSALSQARHRVSRTPNRRRDWLFFHFILHFLPRLPTHITSSKDDSTVGVSALKICKHSSWPNWKRIPVQTKNNSHFLFLSVCKSIVIYCTMKTWKNHVKLSVIQCPKKRLSRVLYRIVFLAKWNVMRNLIIL